MSGPVRSSPFAGTWYPGEPEELSGLVSRLLEAAPQAGIEGELGALVSPHAGLVYSGSIAAAGYRLLRERPVESVLLLGPSHQVFFDAIAVYPRGSFETPLGEVAVDEELAGALVSAGAPRVKEMPDVHAREHCLEMQLPFLQHLLEEFRIVPVMMGNQSSEQIDAATAAIVSAVDRVDRNVILIASSDLSHYETRSRARELDTEVVKCLERFEPEALRSLLRADSRHACGGGPMVSVMLAARKLGARSSRVLAYGDSAEVTGDTSAVVGYVSAAFLA